VRFSTVGCLIILTVSIGIKADGDIVDRIKKIGTVCVTGIACESDVDGDVNSDMVPVTEPVIADAASPVEDNYKKSCATCHNAGLAGAPKLGDKEQRHRCTLFQLNQWLTPGYARKRHVF